jgi:hypothetical protein
MGLQKEGKNIEDLNIFLTGYGLENLEGKTKNTVVTGHLYRDGSKYVEDTGL